jgi:hypothetical protein
VAEAEPAKVRAQAGAAWVQVDTWIAAEERRQEAREHVARHIMYPSATTPRARSRRGRSTAGTDGRPHPSRLLGRCRPARWWRRWTTSPTSAVASAPRVVLVPEPGRRIGRPPGATSRAFEHCQVVYQAMAAQATPAAELPDPRVPAEAVAVWVGNLIPLMRSLGYTSTEQYHRVKHDLIDMECIRQLQTGKRYRVGAWALVAPPSVEAWDAAVARPFSHKRTAQVREDHRRLLRRFLLDLIHGQGAPEAGGAAVLAGASTAGEVVQFVLRLSEAEQRRLFPAGEVCLAELGGPHVCGVAGVDPAAPSHAAGAWKRRRDHLAKLAAEGD